MLFRSAQPLGFIFPAFAGNGNPLWQLRIGVKLYDLLCGGGNFEPSRGLSLVETRELLPALRTEGLRGAVLYFDALTNDARLVIDTLRSAARAGAGVANFARLTAATRDTDGWRATVRDGLAAEDLEVRARAIVNATGPWSDGLPHSAVKLRLTKGIHLVVDHARLPVPGAVVVTEGRRILFAIPWAGRVVLGTTDTDYRGRPEDVAVAPEDTAYVLRTVNTWFSGAALREEHVISHWAGLRPLVANPDGTPSDISRAHEIRSPQPGWWDITGGKLTTYRLMAEQAVDRIAGQLGLRVPASRTAQEPLLPPAEVTSNSGVAPAPFTREAVRHYVEQEWAVRPADVLVRRSGWHHHDGTDAARDAQVARWMAEIGS